MTTTIDLAASQILAIEQFNAQQAETIANAAQTGIITDGEFVFFAAFDGTNNDKRNVPLSGNPQDTNVAQLWDQYEKQNKDSLAFGGNYYPGPGTSETLTASSWLNPQVTKQVIATAEQAYKDFATQASEWLGTVGNKDKPITVALTSFSRGDASAAIFSQMLYERGLIDPNPPHDVLVPPGQIGVSAGVIFDPVTTGVSGNLAFAPNVSNIVDIEALNEYRGLFPGADYSNQAGAITTIGMYGNHCDIGGGYDNGIGAKSLEAATAFLQASGLSITPVSESRSYKAENDAIPLADEVHIHSEEYDDYGHKIWSVSNETGFSFEYFRSLVEVGTPAQPLPDAAGSQTFVLYNGNTVTITLADAGKESVEEDWKKLDIIQKRETTNYVSVAGSTPKIADIVTATNSDDGSTQIVVAQVFTADDKLEIDVPSAPKTTINVEGIKGVSLDSVTATISVTDAQGKPTDQLTGSTNKGSDNVWTGDDGTQYTFVPSASGAPLGTGTLTAKLGILGANEIVINDFDFSKAQSKDGYLGIHLGSEGLALEAGTSRSSDTFVEGDYTPPDVTQTASGALQTFTIYASAVTDTAQQVVLNLAGAATGLGINTGADYFSFADGPITLTIPAGQDSVTVALVNTGDASQSATAQLTATLVDSTDQTVSNSLTVTFQGSGETSQQADRTIVGDLQPINFSTNGGVDYHYDDLGNLIVNPDAPQPGRDDSLNGSAGNDLIKTGDGTNTVIATQGGNDSIVGGSGNDSLVGGTGNNMIEGAGGQDVILAGKGNNRIYADKEVDVATAIENAGTGQGSGQKGSFIAVGNGDNTIVGGSGNDAIILGSGHNLVILGAGNNIVSGGETVGDVGRDWSTTVTTYPLGITMTFNQADVQTTGDYSPNGTYQGNFSTGRQMDGGGSDTIFAGSGNSIISGGNDGNYIDAGTGNSTVFGGDGADTIFGGSGASFLSGQGGDDYIDGESGSRTIIGGAGNNTIFGGSGNDTIDAGDPGDHWNNAQTGDNYVYGGSGNCMIYGSGGNDTLIAGSGNTTINGGSGDEYIEGGDGQCALQSNSGTGTNGDGSDTLVAGDGDTTIYGGQGTDVIYGGDGVDVIYAGSGSTEIDTGDGGTIDHATVVTLGSGNATVYGGAGVLHVTGGSGNDTLIAGDGDTTLTGGSGNELMYAGAGNDLITGGSGSDTLYGGAGSATIQGGSGTTLFVSGEGETTLQGGSGNNTYEIDADAGDVLIYPTASSDTLKFGAGIALAQLSLTGALDNDGNPVLEIDLADGGTVMVEGGLEGSLNQFSFADSGQTYTLKQVVREGSAYANDVSGANGDLLFSADDGDTLTGTGGNDTLVAFGAGETLVGGGGDTIFLVNEMSEVVSNAPNTGHNSVYASVSYVLPENVQALTLTGSDNLTAVGNADAHTLTANRGNDTLIAGSGLATLIGGAGNDAFVVNNSDDIVVEQANQGDNTVFSSVDYVLPANVQNLTGTGTAGLALTGNTIANRITGSSGNDTLIAGTGVATLIGGSGNDTFIVNNASDVIVEQANQGSDTVFASANYVLSDNLEQLVLIGQQALTATGNATGSTLTANDGNDTLRGGAGNTTLIGGAGVDTFGLGSGMGASTIIDSAAGAVIQLEAGIDFNDVVTTRSGNDLLLTVRGISASLRIQDYALHPGTAWTIQDSSGQTTTPDAMIAATEQTQANLALSAERNYAAKVRLGIIQNLQNQGYTQSADGSWEKDDAIPLTATFSATKTVDLVTTASDVLYSNGTHAATTYSTQTYTTYSVNDFSVVAMQDRTWTITDTASVVSDAIVYANSVQTTSSSQAIWLGVNWSTLPGSTIYPETSQTSTPALVTLGTGLPAWITYTTFNDVTVTNLQGELTGGLSYSSDGTSTSESLPSSISGTLTQQVTTCSLGEIDLSPGDHVVYGNSNSMVMGGVGNNTIYYAGFAYGGTGNAKLMYGDTLMAGTGEQWLQGGATMIVGDGHDTVVAGANEDIEVSRDNAGIDLILDEDNSANSLIDAFYRAQGIPNWQKSYASGGKYTINISDSPERGKVYDTADAMMTGFAGWNVTLAEVLSYGWASKIGMLPTLVVVPGSTLVPSSAYANSAVPVVTLSANDFSELQPLYDAGFLVSPKVTFGDGISCADLRFSWNTIASPTDGLQHVVLEITWGDDQGIEVMIPHANDTTCSVINDFIFSDGTHRTLSDLIALAPAAPDFDPEFFQFKPGMGAQILGGDDFPGVSIKGAAKTDFLYSRDGDALVLMALSSSDSLRIDGWFSRTAEQVQLAIKFDDETLLMASQTTSLAPLLDGRGGDQTLTGLAGFANVFMGGNNDTLVAGGGDATNTFYFNLGNGQNTIVDSLRASSGSNLGDVVQFGAGVTIANTRFVVQGADLLIVYGTLGDSVLVKNFAPNGIAGAQVISKFRFADATQESYTNDGNGNSNVIAYSALGKVISSFRQSSDGSYGNTMFMADGAWRTNDYFADGSSRSEDHLANGTLQSDSWAKADGTTGTEAYSPDGSCIGETHNPDGSYSTSTNDAKGNSATEDYDSLGRMIGKLWEKADGSHGSECYDADGSSHVTLVNADGSSSTFIDDGQGSLTTTNYDLLGTKLNDEWTHADGSSGNDTFNTDGSSSGLSLFVDGSGSSYTDDGQGNATTITHDVSGTLTGDTWTKAGGQHGMDSYGSDQSKSHEADNADGSGQRTWTNADGSYGTESINADGSSTSTSYDANGVRLGGSWRNADGSTGSTAVLSDGSVETKETSTANGVIWTKDTITSPDGSSEIKQSCINVGGFTSSSDRIYSPDGSYQTNYEGSDGSYGVDNYVASTGELSGSSFQPGSYTYTYDNTVRSDGATESKGTFTYSDGSTRTTDSVYNVDGTRQDNWIASDGSYGNEMFAADGSAYGTNYASLNGAYDTYSDDGKGNFTDVSFAADGTALSDRWTHADGSYGYDSFNADGSSSSDTYLADGGHITQNDNGQGAVTTLHIDVNGNMVYQCYQSPDGSSYAITENVTDGSYQTATDDGQGNRTTTSFGADGTEIGDSWQHTDGTHGSDTYAADGSSVTTVYGVDGRYNATADDGQGYRATLYYNADGSIDVTNGALCAGSVTTTNPDGSYGIYTNDGLGNAITVNYDPAGVRLNDSWTHVDGSTGNDSFNADGSSSSDTYLADGGCILGWDDGYGTIHTIQISPSGKFLGELTQTPDGRQTEAAGGNLLLLGGAQNDALCGGSGNNVLVGGAGNDTLVTGSGCNVIAFDKGDGQDTVDVTSGQNNTLSLGGQFACSDLSLQSNGTDLVLDIGNNDSLTFKNWYASSANKNVVTLQVIAEAMTDFAEGSADVLRNSKVETFDFQQLVSEFDQARSTDPTLSNWSLTSTLLDAHLAGSDSAALGGDLAYEYGERGNLAGFAIASAGSVVADPAFAVAAQTVQPWATVSAGANTLQ